MSWMSCEKQWRKAHMSDEEREEAYYDKLETKEEFGSYDKEQAQAIGETRW